MIEIIPNWHPFLVHFTVALFTAAFGFYLLSYLFIYAKFLPGKIGSELEIVGRWCLWAAAFFTIFTVIAGLDAYYTVRHDTASHAAMTNHRNWALPTAGAIFFLTIWSVWRHYKRKNLTLLFVIALILVEGMLLSTAWRGGELVYRHGVGVMSLPKTEMKQHMHGNVISPVNTNPQEQEHTHEHQK